MFQSQSICTGIDSPEKSSIDFQEYLYKTNAKIQWYLMLNHIPTSECIQWSEWCTWHIWEGITTSLATVTCVRPNKVSQTFWKFPFPPAQIVNQHTHFCNSWVDIWFVHVAVIRLHSPQKYISISMLSWSNILHEKPSHLTSSLDCG